MAVLEPNAVWRRLVLDDGRPDVCESESGEMGLGCKRTLVGGAEVYDDAYTLGSKRVDSGRLEFCERR